jgi:glycerophosphoryl diester phosphodiesterase
VSLPAGLTGAPIAHRGLWRSGGAPENSLSAFEAACKAGYGVELDVRLSADGEVMVFHDETLERMTASSGMVEEQTADELRALRLLGSDQTIPTLDDVIRLIDGRVLVLVELKTPPGQEGLLESRVADLLARSPGAAAVLSFNAEALAWMWSHAPRISRGLNAQTPEQLGKAAVTGADFLSVKLDLAPHPDVQAWRQTGKAIAWTARSPADRDRLKGLADNLMFEGFKA